MKQELVCKSSQLRISNKVNLDKTDANIDGNGCSDDMNPLDKENVINPFASPPCKSKQIIPSGWHIPRTPLNEISRSKTSRVSPQILSSMIPPPPAFEDTANFVERKKQIIPDVIDSDFLLSPPSDFRDKKEKDGCDDVSMFSINNEMVKKLKPSSETPKSIHMLPSSPQLSCHSYRSKSSPVIPSLYYDPHPKCLHENKNRTFVISKANSPIDIILTKEKPAQKMVHCQAFNKGPLELEENLPLNALDTLEQSSSFNSCPQNGSFLKWTKEHQQLSFSDSSPKMSNLEHSITGGKIPRGNVLPRTPPHNATFLYENINRCEQNGITDLSSQLTDKNTSPSCNVTKSENVHSTNIEKQPELTIQDKSLESFQEPQDISTNRRLSSYNVLSDDSLELFITRRKLKCEDQARSSKTCIKEITKEIVKENKTAEKIKGKDLTEVKGQEIAATIGLQRHITVFNSKRVESEINKKNNDSTFIYKEIKQPNGVFEELDEKCLLVEDGQRVKKCQGRKPVKSKKMKENESDSSLNGKKNYHERQNKEIKARLKHVIDEKIMENTQTKMKCSRVQKLDDVKTATEKLKENTLESNEIKGTKKIIENMEEKCQPFKEIRGNIKTKPKRSKRTQSKKGPPSDVQLDQEIEEVEIKKISKRNTKNKPVVEGQIELKADGNNVKSHEINGTKEIVNMNEETSQPFVGQEKRIETKPKRSKGSVNKMTKSKKDTASDIPLDEQIKEVEINKKEKRNTKTKIAVEKKIELKTDRNNAVNTDLKSKGSRKSHQKKCSEAEINTTLSITNELKVGNQLTCEESKISPKSGVTKCLRENKVVSIQPKAKTSKVGKDSLNDIHNLTVLKTEDDSKKPCLRRKKGAALETLESTQQNDDVVELRDTGSMPLSKTIGEGKVKLPSEKNSFENQQTQSKVAKKEDMSDKDTRSSDEVYFKENSGRPQRQSKVRAIHAISSVLNEMSF